MAVNTQEDIDWYPLPEINSKNNNGVNNTPSLPSVMKPPRSEYNVETKYNDNLSILSLKSSTFTSQATPLSVSPTSRPSTTPTHNQLDYLWNKFLEMYISKPHPFFVNADTQKQENNCMCTCHRSSLTTPSSLKFNVSPPPETPKPSLRRMSHLSSRPHTKDTLINHQHTQDTPIIINSHKESTKINSKSELPISSQKPIMEKLSLQDACRHFKKSFIKNSQERQKALKNRHRLIIKIPIENPANSLIRNSLIGTRHDSNESSSVTHFKTCFQNANDKHTSRKSIKMDISPPPPVIPPSLRPKMSMKAMYHQSKRYWNTLPEVQAKEKEKKREKDAATNRLRVKVYQKEVLARMRRLRRNNQIKRSNYNIISS